jgi:alkanesulfonate monooxygenase SsuD/methylene tetrahydromethanopterin reductase-like flavin-dependent oxidoreductase (luciferase family)
VQLCAKWADEYNTIFVGEDRCRELRGELDRAFQAEDRDSAEARLSLMTGVVVGEDGPICFAGPPRSPRDWVGAIRRRS